MSSSLLAWLIGLGLFVLLSLNRPIYGLLAYIQTFFFAPAYWWWGKPIAEHRWSLLTGFVALGAGLLYTLRKPDVVLPESSLSVRLVNGLMLVLWLNASLVHLLLAPSLEISSSSYWELTRFVVLHFVFQLCIRTSRDLESVLVFILFGMAYIGYEVTINDRGSIVQNRLEGVGVPGGADANHLASVVVTFLPLIGVLFTCGKWYHRLLAMTTGPLALNVLLLCNSRGGFLGAIVVGITFLCCAPKKYRKKIILTIALGVLALYLLLGDQRIITRFLTTFNTAEQRDQSAQGRIRYWQAGLKIVIDHPLGSGGDAFKKVHGPSYIAELFDERYDSRSVHQGFINEACEWGVQGLTLRLAVLLCALRLVRHYTKKSFVDRVWDLDPTLISVGLYSGALGFLTTCFFGSVLGNEWGYWLVALAVVLEQVYGQKGKTKL